MPSLMPSPRLENLSARLRSPMRLGFALLLLLSAATLGACATSLPPASVAPQEPLKIPPPPVLTKPPPSGTYWLKHCAFRLSLQEQLKVTLEKSDHCKTPGHGEVQKPQGRTKAEQEAADSAAH